MHTIFNLKKINPVSVDINTHAGNDTPSKHGISGNNTLFETEMPG